MATTTQQQPQQQPQEEPRLSPEDIQEQAAAQVDQGDGEAQPAQPHMDRGKGRAARRKKARARSEGLPQDGDQDGQDSDEDVCKARSPSRSQLAKVPSNSPSVLMSSGGEVSGDRESIGTDRRNWTIRSAATCTVSFTISTHRKE